MAEHPLYQFRLFFRDTPTMFSRWRAYDEERRWDRHYLLGGGLSLRIDRGERIELTRWAMQDMFAIESTVLSSAFPLDWMSLSVITRSLPRDYRLVEIDGRDAQSFVDSLAFQGLVQASVLKHERYLREGAVMATSSRIQIPDWKTEAISVNLSSHHAQSLRQALETVEMDRYQHMGFDEWLSAAHATAFPAPKPQQDEDEDENEQVATASEPSRAVPEPAPLQRAAKAA